MLIDSAVLLKMHFYTKEKEVVDGINAAWLFLHASRKPRQQPLRLQGQCLQQQAEAWANQAAEL
jgi:hypothetical protein